MCGTDLAFGQTVESPRPRDLLVALSLASAPLVLGCVTDAIEGGRDSGPDAIGIKAADAALGDATTSDASVDSPGMPESGPPPCVPSPVIHGNLAPVWSMALGAGALGGVVTDSSNDIIVAGTADGAITVGSSVIAPADAGPARPADAAFGETIPGSAFVIKLASSGQLLWQQWLSVQGSVGGVGLDAQGSIYVAGEDDVGSIYIAKLDRGGAMLWRRAFSPSAYLASLSLAVDPTGGAAVIGSASRPAAFVEGGADLGFIVSVDAAGQTRYSKGFGGVYGASASARFDPTGHLFATGVFSGSLDLGPPLTAPPQLAAFVAELGPAGQVQWQLADGTASNGSAVAATSAGAFVGGNFSGTIGTVPPAAAAQGPEDLFLAQFDQSGHPTFETSFPAAGGSIDGLSADPTGGVVAIGQIKGADLGGGPLPGPGVLLAKLDASGRHVFSASFAVSEPASAASVAVDSSGAIVAGGGFFDAIDLGTGVLAADSLQPSLSPTMFLARYAQQAPAPITPRGCPLDGGLPDAGRLVTAAGAIEVALSPTQVYWSTTWEVMGASVSGGDPVVLAYAQGPVSLATDSRSIYWANGGVLEFGGAIVSLGLDGGAPATLASSQDYPAAIAVDDAGVYWTTVAVMTSDGGRSSGAILSVPFDGGTPSVLATDLVRVGPIAATNGVVAFAFQSIDAGTSGPTQIASISSAGGAPNVLATTDRAVVSVALDATTVYWAEASSSGLYDDGRIRSVRLAGGALTELAGSQPGPNELVLVGSTLYWSTSGHANYGGATDAGPVNNAGLWSLPTTGGAPVPLVSGRRSIGHFAVDAHHAAWVGSFDSPSEQYGLFVMDR